MFEEATRQAALDAMGILDTPPDERVDRVTRLAKEMFGVPMVSVSLIDRNRQWRKSQIGLDGDEAPREDSFCDQTVRQDSTLVVEDASIAEQFADNPFVRGDPHLRFYAGHPLHAPGGAAVGTLCILDTEPRTLTESQRNLLRDLAFWVQNELAREQDVDQAAAIQAAMRERRPPHVPGYTIASGGAAYGKLSGDFADLSLHHGRLRITLADAMGKGVGAAIGAAAVRGSLRTAPDRSLLTAIDEVDRLLEDDLGDRGIFITAVHGELDPPTGRLELVDAGHSLAFVLREQGGWYSLRSTGLPLGMGMADLGQRETAIATMDPGDTFVCCSDGLLDVLDPDDPFGHVERVIRALGPDGAVAEALRLAEDERATDDITVVIVRRDA
jgi:hypothetical protein